MEWLTANSTNIIFFLLIVILLFKGPIMGRIYGVSTISVHDLNKKLSSPKPPLLVDVRTNREYNGGSIKGSQLITLSSLGQRMDDLKKRYGEREIAVICRSGNRSISGSIKLKKAGFPNVLNVAGGMIQWTRQGFPTK